MAQRGEGPDFIEALARGLDVIRAFHADRPRMTLAEVAAATGLARPTARRILLTLEELGYVRTAAGGHELTPRVLELGMAYVGALSLWDMARPHMEQLVAATGESSSITQLDGSDVVYLARVAVPKIIALRVQIGTRFPAAVTSQGKVLLAALPPDRLDAVLALPSRSGIQPWVQHGRAAIDTMLREVNARGWALADNELAPGIRSVAVPIRDGRGEVRAAMNVTVNSAETSTKTLLDRHLPHLQRAAGAISSDWALWQSRPQVDQASDDPSPAVARG
ncbi:helix-turn-helix domain-containing protein [Dactylosporangium sp. NBC_01737]|uniref:IclR family transcriptional regulator domain-containing protein n=1 Tax=Dactylosporangium sp. NBC_01737 TaxID=2975959 RepID=UPI002E11C03D|nr:helix-turn-helix domain-containing protein [Dactylosporangium sp. NBC_01737]